MTFNWRDYVDLSAYRSGFKDILEQAMDDMAEKPEFQAMLKKAYEENDNIRIKLNGQSGGPTNAVPKDGLINLSEDTVRRLAYLGKNGDLHDFSINRILFHEFYHLADDNAHKFLNMSDEQRQSYFQGQAEKIIPQMASDYFSAQTGEHKKFTLDQALVYLDKQYDTNADMDAFVDLYVRNSNPVEKPTVDATNNFMSKYYGEEPRGPYAYAAKTGSDDIEIRLSASHTMGAKP